jgi:hypothetical protein
MIQLFLRSRWFLFAAWAAVVGSGAALGLWLRPEPHGDWAYYWLASDALRLYERGGAGLWVLGALKTLGLAPIAAALLLNALSVAMLLWAMRRSDTSRWRVPTLLMVAYLLAIVPFLGGLVQLDMIATACVAMGISLAQVPVARWSRAVNLVVACTLVALGVSTKQQYALIVWGMAALFVPCWWLLRHRDTRAAATLMGVLLVGSFAGFGIDLAARSASERSTDSLRTTSAVTLYSGLLVSSTAFECGKWTEAAGPAARADMGKPLHVAVLDRLRSHPPRHWLAVMACKTPRIVHPDSFAVYWLLQAPSVVAAMEQRHGKDDYARKYVHVHRTEERLYSLLTWVMLAFAFGAAVWSWRRGQPMLALLAVLWVLAFWGVHLVFEIQGRYFLGMYLILPLLCAVGMRGASRTMARPGS